MNISELKPNANATLERVTVDDVPPARSFDKFGKQGQVTTAKISDASGSCDFTLWNDEINLVKKGDVVSLKDVWVKEWNGKVQVSKGKMGKIEKVA